MKQPVVYDIIIERTIKITSTVFLDSYYLLWLLGGVIMAEVQELYGVCPYFTSQKILAGKWAILILHHLDGETLRFNELEKRLGKITQSTLTKQLRSLEENNLIVRKVYNQVPPKVEYSLSELGVLFKPVLASLETWGNSYIEYLNGETE